MGFYDENAEAYAEKFRFEFSSYGGMCWYNFENFYKKDEIKSKLDKEIQSLFLEKINKLIDIGIIEI